MSEPHPASIPVAAGDAAAGTPTGRAQQLIDAVTDELVRFRRDLHAHPEIGYAEHRTTARIVQRLTDAGLRPAVLSLGTGATVDIVPDGWSPGGGLIGLRADIDALPIPDAKDVPYASTVPDACHACGHDVHTSVVVGVGVVLARLRDEGLLRRGVRLIFQPAEERNPGGAPEVIAAGALDGVTSVYALHCDPRTDVGRVALRAGAITSACDRVLVRLTGPGGHTSRPHLTGDLVGALAALATELPFLLSRRVDPRGGVSLIWGRAHAGTTANAIPRSGELEGTLRATGLNGWRAAGDLLAELCEQVVRPFGIKLQLELSRGVPPTVNHPEGVRALADSAASMLGPESVTDTEQSLGGEDFSWMLQRVPGAMARLGVRTPGRPIADIHSPTFDVDERCIAAGVRVLSGVVLGDGTDPEAVA